MQTAPDQRNAEQQIERDGRADDLGEVAGGDGELAEHPQEPDVGRRVVIAAGLGEIAPGDDPELDAESACSRIAIRFDIRMTLSSV